MRTNIEIHDQLMEEAMQLTKIKTKRALVDAALRSLINTHKIKQLAGLRGKVKWEGDLDQMRKH